jgi:hypothetical protein
MKTGLVSSLSAVCLLALPSSARADSWTALIFDGGDNRLFSDEVDWSQGAYKAECGGETTTVLGGVSATAKYYPGVWPFMAPHWIGETHAALCVSTSMFVNPYATDTLNIFTEGFPQGSDNRLDTSTGDWAYGYWKGECAANEAVFGISQWPDGQFSSIHCGVITNMTAPARCAPQNFDGHDGRQAPSRAQDWDEGYWKGECSPGNYVKGVAMSTGEHHEAAVILCCTF